MANQTIAPGAADGALPRNEAVPIQSGPEAPGLEGISQIASPASGGVVGLEPVPAAPQAALTSAASNGVAPSPPAPENALTVIADTPPSV